MSLPRPPEPPNQEHTPTERRAAPRAFFPFKSHEKSASHTSQQARDPVPQNSIPVSVERARAGD